MRVSLLFLVMVFGLPAMALSNGFPRTLTLDNGTELYRVGEATFRWTVFRVYDGAFFRERGVNGDRLYAKHLELLYHTDISADRIIQGGNAILRRNVFAEQMAALQDRIDTINSAFRDVTRGDRFSLTFIPGTGTQLRFNGELLATIPGDDFAQAYFQIWLGDDPISDSFRDRLLGLR